MSRKTVKQKAKIYPKKFIPPKKDKSSDSPEDNDKINNIYKLLNIEKNAKKKSCENEEPKIKKIVKAHIR